MNKDKVLFTKSLTGYTLTAGHSIVWPLVMLIVDESCYIVEDVNIEVKTVIGMFAVSDVPSCVCNLELIVTLLVNEITKVHAIRISVDGLLEIEAIYSKVELLSQ